MVNTARRLFVSLEDAAEILDREQGVGWDLSQVKARRDQYHAAVLEHLETVADRRVQPVIPLWLKSVEQWAGQLNAEQASQLLRWTEERLAGILPLREELYRQRWAVCPLCSRVFVRSNQKRAQKHCPVCRSKWTSKKRSAIQARSSRKQMSRSK